jgi:hypothetical protein
MNLSPEAFEQVLTELADRADAHPVVDRVPAVRGRARRNARRRAGALVTALAVLIVMASGAAGFGGLPMLRGQDPAKKPAPPRPYLSVQLVRDQKLEATRPPRFVGGRVVVVDVIMHGRVPRWTGYQSGADVRDNLWEALLYADHGSTIVTVRPTQLKFDCDPAAPLVDINTSFPVTLNYGPGRYIPMLGTHDLRFTASACAPAGLATAKLNVVLK